MTPAFNVLFLCTHNSARSIIAEALLEKIGRGKFRAYSAGSDPARAPMPDVIGRLQALGHDVSKLRCKSWNEFTGPNAPRMDFVIALCDTPQGQVCPDFGEKFVTGAWPFPDPAEFTGSPTERVTLLNELYAHDPPAHRDFHQPAVRFTRQDGVEGAAGRNRRYGAHRALTENTDERRHQRHGAHRPARLARRVRRRTSRRGDPRPPTASTSFMSTN